MAVSDPPTDQNIDSFISFTASNLDRAQVIRRLRYHNNNLEAAINDYFEDPNSTKYNHTPSANQQAQAWDNLPFNNDRDGPPNTSGIGFRIDADDEFPPTYGPKTLDGVALSRPPSRTSNNRSPLNKVIDLTAQAEAADPSTSRTYDHNDSNDTDFARAIAASLAPQETGVTSTSQAVFGPATRSQAEYEQGDWGMVPIGKSSAHEVLSDPEPEDRKRDFGTPAFLKPSVGDHRLGALLTIYYEIPMLREIFLDRSQVIANYGNDKQWWNGKSIEAPMVAGVEGNETADVVHEVQRLMAFLDKTDRSYGSVEALANLPLIKRYLQTSNVDLETAVLEVYLDYFQNNQVKVNNIFSRGVDGPQESSTKVFAILDLALPKKESFDETIYDIADNVLWDSADIDLDKSPFLANIGEVITFRFCSSWGSKENKVLVPIVWYPDRYLFTGREAALEMRRKKNDVKKQLHDISVIENALTNYEIRHGELIKVEDLFKAALQHDVDELENNSERADNMEDGAVSPQRSSKTKKLSAELRKLAERIDRKLQALSEEKEKAKAALRELSKLYTQQPEDPEQPPLHKYTLRGVSTSKDTMYICRQAVPELVDIDLADDSSNLKGDQWWKIHYAVPDSKPVNIGKTTEQKVLEAAGDSRSLMLVYASEKAMGWQSYEKLPIQLEQFVRKDNSWFKTEFPQQNSPVSSPKSPASPSKRKTGSSETSDEAFQERKSLKISEKEVMDTYFDHTLDGNRGSETIVGVDPSLQEPNASGQEMQERSSMRILSARSQEPLATNSKPVDSMDLDQVMEDDNIAQESGAVRHVGFLD